MQEDIITLETAKLAVEKGFDIIPRYGSIASLYRKDGEHTYYTNYGFMGSGSSDGYIPSPTQALLQKWLRKKHNMNVEVFATIVSASDKSGFRWMYLVHSLVGHTMFIEDESPLGWLTPEEALEEGLRVALNSLQVIS